MLKLVNKTIIVGACTLLVSTAFARPTFLSVSTDGKYAVSSNDDSSVSLYNLDKKSITKVNDKLANPFSANFIDGTHNFIYQNKDDNIVHIVDADNLKTVKEFDAKINATTEAINKDMTIYVATTNDGNISIFKIDGDKIGKDKYIYGNNYSNMYGQIIPTFTQNQNKIVATTSTGKLWIFDLGEIFKLEKDNPKNQISIKKNTGATMNAIDPNGQFVYTADSGLSGIKYNLNDGAKSNSALYYPDDNLENISYVQETKDRKKYFYNGLTNFKFIDKDKIIVTFNGKNQPYLWAFTFDTNKLDWSNNTKWKRPVFFSKNYLPLTKDPLKFVTGNYRDNTDPFPIVGGYNTTFDTSVEAHKLVMAQANGNGIMVYNYNPKDESLKLDWVGEPAKAEEKKEESKGWFW